VDQADGSSSQNTLNTRSQRNTNSVSHTTAEKILVYHNHQEQSHDTAAAANKKRNFMCRGQTMNV